MPTDDPIPVNPISETAEPVVPEKEPEPSPPPKAEAPDAETPTAESVEGRSQETPKPEEQPKADPPKPEKSRREQLIDQLTGAEEPKSEDEDEDAEPPAETGQDKAPETSAKDTPKDKPEEAPEDLTELTNDTAKAMKPGEVRRKINRLIKRVKEAEPFAAGYKEIVETCEANGFSPDDYKAWVGLGIGLQQKNPQAAALLKQVAAKAGIPLEAPAPASALTPEVEAWLDAQVKDLEISAPAAAELRKRLAAKPTPPPAAQPPPQPTAPPQPQAPAPHQDAVLRKRAEQDLDKVVAEYEAKLGKARFDELQPRIIAGLKARQGAHPAAWGDIMRSVIEVELAKLPKLATPQSTLRPGGAKAGSAAPSFKTERERAIHRLTNGA